MTFHPEYKDKTRRGKHVKKKTACEAIRRSNGCGICGSENIAKQGVKFCNLCGKEIEFVIESTGFLWPDRTGIKLNCGCKGRWIDVPQEPKVLRALRVQIIFILKCMDCGAVMSCFCPNCKNIGTEHGHGYRQGSRDCWHGYRKLEDPKNDSTGLVGVLYCKSCGFRT